MATKKYKYKGYDAKTVKARARESTGSFDHYLKDGTPRYKMSDGDNNGRILPAQDAWNDNPKMVKKWGSIWYITIWVHTFIGPDSSNFLCRKKMLKEPCAICDARADLTEDEVKLDKKLKPQARALAWWIDRDDEKAGPQVISMPMSKVAQELAARQINKKTGELLAIDHPDEGYDVSFEKSGAGLKTQYTGVDIERESAPLSESSKTMAKWLDFIMENPLPELLIYHENDYMEETLMGKKARKDEDEDDDDDDDNKKSKRRKKRDEEDEDEDDDKKSKKSKRRSEDEDDDTDDDSSNEDEDDGDDRRSSKRKSRSKDEDEDAGEEDDDDKKSSKKKRRSKDEDEGDDDDDRSSKKKKSRRDEDEDEEGDGDEDEDEDDKKSKRKSRSKDEDEDGEDDDDPPSKGKRRASKDDDGEEDEDDDRSSKARKAIDRVKKRHNRD